MPPLSLPTLGQSTFCANAGQATDRRIRSKEEWRGGFMPRDHTECGPGMNPRAWKESRNNLLVQRQGAAMKTRARIPAHSLVVCVWFAVVVAAAVVVRAEESPLPIVSNVAQQPLAAQARNIAEAMEF